MLVPWPPGRAQAWPAAADACTAAVAAAAGVEKCSSVERKKSLIILLLRGSQISFFPFSFSSFFFFLSFLRSPPPRASSYSPAAAAAAAHQAALLSSSGREGEKRGLLQTKWRGRENEIWPKTFHIFILSIAIPTQTSIRATDKILTYVYNIVDGMQMSKPDR